MRRSETHVAVRQVPFPCEVHDIIAPCYRFAHLTWSWTHLLSDMLTASGEGKAQLFQVKSETKCPGGESQELLCMAAAYQCSVNFPQYLPWPLNRILAPFGLGGIWPILCFTTAFVQIPLENTSGLMMCQRHNGDTEIETACVQALRQYLTFPSSSKKAVVPDLIVLVRERYDNMIPLCHVGARFPWTDTVIIDHLKLNTSFDDFRNKRLKHQWRRDMKVKTDEFVAKGGRIMHITQPEQLREYAPSLYRLHNTLSNEHAAQGDLDFPIKFTEWFFRECGRYMKEGTWRVICAMVHDELVAFGLVLINVESGTTYLKRVGANASARDSFAYFNILYEVIKVGFETGCDQVDFGDGGWAMKHKLSASKRPADAYLLSVRNPLWSVFIHIAASLCSRFLSQNN
ncbi:hypothetical protein Pelo_4446 [Pelomyxa schiedti]|nr:hypothetical protein Pelo_4446 [Pelomyxa schiedti]